MKTKQLPFLLACLFVLVIQAAFASVPSAIPGSSLTAFAPAATQSSLGWWNLQWPPSGTIQQGGSFLVYAQVWMDGVTNSSGQGAGIQAWIGVSAENTDPSTWTTWIPASYHGDAGNNDEYNADIAGGLTPGTYYYASRFQYQEEGFVYGGYGGTWNGTENNSGELTVTALPQIEWANLQWPAEGLINPNEVYNVYAQVFKSGVTEAAGQGAGIQAWMGYSAENTDPATWTNWVVAGYNADVGNNDEYVADIAVGLPAGTYYYASRFKLGDADYVYGGYKSGGGGFWNGTDYQSGVLKVTTATIFRGDGDWSSTERWSTGAVPGAATDVVINGNAALNGSAQVNALEIISGQTLTINASQQLTVDGALINSGTLTLKSGATMLTNGAITGDGTTQVEQELAVNRNWWYLASPLTSATSNVFRPAGSANLMGDYSEPTASYSDPFAADSSTPLTAGRGYVVHLDGTGGGTYTFTGGQLNTGDIPLTPTRTGVHAKRGFNLIGNPYPSYLNWNAVYNDTENPAVNMRDAIWFRTYDDGQMVFHTYGDGDAVPEVTSPLIAPMQAFWVKVAADGSNGSLTFKNAHRSHATAESNPLKVTSNDGRQRLRLLVSNGSRSDETLLVGKSYASNGLDPYDIDKMSNNSVLIPEIYSLVDNREIVINSLQQLEEGRVVNLGFRPGQAGTFTLKVTQFEQIDDLAVLLDKQNNTETTLSDGTIYHFSADETVDNERFVIEFRAPEISTAMDQHSATSLLIWSDASRELKIQGAAKGEMIRILTVAGQEIAMQLSDDVITIVNGEFKPGVYIVTVNNQAYKVVIQ